MLLRLRSLVLLLFAIGLVSPAQTARGDVNPHSRLKKHVRDVVQKVKAAPTATEKRSILNKELRRMISALDRIENYGSLSKKDKRAVDALRTRLQAKLDELRGANGYEAVPDGELDAFADYVQQDFERADTVTISVTTALLIIILIVLLA